MTNDNNEQQPTPEQQAFNPIDSYSRAMERLDKLVTDGAEEFKERYTEAIKRTISAYYSFMDAQQTMDDLAKFRAEQVKMYEQGMIGGVEFVSEMLDEFNPIKESEGNVIKPSAWNTESDSDDEDNDPKLN